jgi:hypothetical protein
MLPPNPAHTGDLLAKKNNLLEQKQMLSDTVRIN